MYERARYYLRLSRPRFWIYTAGTFVVGYCIAAQSWAAFYRPEYFIYLLYFFVPANILIYGVNDYWDAATDKGNPKKGEKEIRLASSQRSELSRVLAFVVVLSIVLMVVQDGMVLRALFATFLLLSYFYSAPPLRFKGIPFIDFSSNMLYVMPGIFAYHLAAGELPSLVLVVAGYCHIAAMHLFSAIPDITYDAAAGIRTTATFLGHRASLALCLVFWGILAILAIVLSDMHVLSFLSLAYPLVPAALLADETLDIRRVYWVLPYINIALGGLLTLMLVLAIR
ncbi:prenyltransferase [archaeon]|nr:MAG: prenyltransferase [archaeon]